MAAAVGCCSLSLSFNNVLFDAREIFAKRAEPLTHSVGHPRPFDTDREQLQRQQQTSALPD